MVPNIIFDMGGVLLEWNETMLMEYYYSDLTEEEQQKVKAAIFSSGLWRRFDRGDFDEGTIIREVCALLPPHLHSHVKFAIPHFWESMPVLPTNELIPLLKARGQRAYLLSNAPQPFHHVKHRLPYLDLFDGVFASCDVGLLKPDPEIYRVFLHTFGLRAQECLFIDDMRANIEGAASVGMHGHCFEDRDLEGLRKALGL